MLLLEGNPFCIDLAAADGGADWDGGVWVNQRIVHPTKQDRTSRDLVSLPGSAAGLVSDLGQIVSSFCSSISPVCNMVVVMGWFPLPQKSKAI